MNRQMAIKYRKKIEQAATSLTDEDALDAPEMYPHWHDAMILNANGRIYHNGKLYRVVQEHTTQTGWEPDITPALFTEVARSGEIPEWRQPTGAQDAYMTGDKVRHNDAVWVSTVDNNVWEPGVYGWDEVE